MKKVFLILCMFSFVSVIKAECSYTELKELNTLASYVETSYKYNEVSGKFDLSVLNVPNRLYVKVNRKKYDPSGNMIEIGDFTFGQEIKIEIYSSTENECINEYLRQIKLEMPYMNLYYGTPECVGHENLDVCSHKFLPYQLTSITFNKLISEDFDNSFNDKDEEDVKKDKDIAPSIWTNIWNLYMKYGKIAGIPILLVLISSAVTISICAVIYRKVKHGL